MFELHSVTKIFSNKMGSILPVLDDLSYTFLPDVSYAIMGSSGVGKSTLLYLLAGLEKPTAGSICWNGKLINHAHSTRTSHEQFLLHDVGLVFQNPCLVPELNVIENIGIKGLIVGMSYHHIEERVHDLATKFGLTTVMDHPVGVLSGGQQQRIAVARALFLKPRYLLFDEPTAHVDAASAYDMLTVLNDLKTAERIGCIMVSHDPKIAHTMDTILYMRNGKLYESE